MVYSGKQNTKKNQLLSEFSNL